jgi:maleylpyruvate isomerase
VDKPQSEIDGCRVAHQRLRAEVGGLGDTDFARPSQLPGWSVGHVLTHLARNAEAMCRRIEGAMRSEMVEQYAGGPSGRIAEIESGSERQPTEIREDVIDWSIRLDELFNSVPDDVWGRPVRTASGSEHPAALLPFRRWREVEVHLVDLGRGVTPSDWSDGLVGRALPRLVAGLSDRADQRELMAWLLGRGPAPELRPRG